MRLRGFRTFLAFFVTLAFAVHFALWNYSEEKPPAYRFAVKIPEAFDENFTDEELREYIESGNVVPIGELKRRGLPLPDIDKFVVVSLEKDGNLRINDEIYGTLKNPARLTEKLSEIFADRRQAGVFEETGSEVANAVIVKAARAEKYGNVVKVIDAVKQSAAAPVVLRIDYLPD